MNFGRAIKLVRTQRNMSQADLASRAGLSVSYVSMLERGQRDPNLTSIEKIAGALEVPVSILMFLAAEPNEIKSISPELAEKLSAVTLDLLRTHENESASL